MSAEAEEAYALAEELIAQAKAEGWEFLNLSGNTSKETHKDEKRSGDERFENVEVLPPQLSDLKHLTRLDLDNTQVAELKPLAGLTALQALYLDRSQVTELAPLAGLTALRTLTLSNTQVAEIAPLAELTELQILILANTQIAELAPLAGLRALRRLHFRDTPACAIEPELQALSEIDDIIRRTHKTLRWLRARANRQDHDDVEEDTSLPPTTLEDALREARQGSGRSLERTSNFTGSDYRVRPDGSQMDEVPVAGPAAEITDPFKIRDQADRVSTLGDLASGLFADMKADQPNVPNSLRRDIGRFASEMKKDPEAVRPEFVHQMTSFFEFAIYDPDIRGALDKYDLNKLEDLCARAHAMMARAYVARLEEILRAENEPLPPGTTLLGLEKALEDAIELTSGPVWTPFPALPPTLVEIMPQQVESAREQRLRLEIKPEAARTEGARQLAISNRPIWQPPRRPWGAGWNGRRRTRSSPVWPPWAA
ncbi:MAG: hypothetical protein AAGI03_16180 [Pseudomonadota bacterium]